MNHAPPWNKLTPAPPPYVLSRPAGAMVRREAANRETAQLALRDAVRAVVIQESACRQSIAIEWSRSADALVRNPRRLEASVFLLPALAVVETCQAGRRAAIGVDEEQCRAALRACHLDARRVLRGIGPMERFLAQWARRRRALAARFSLALVRLQDREAALRRDLLRAWRDEADAAQRAFLEAAEVRARAILSRGLLRSTVGVGLLSLCLAEAAERHAILTSTANTDVALSELLARRSLAGDERRARVAVFASLRTSHDSVLREEGFWRAAAVGEESHAFVGLERLLGRLYRLAQRRELEAEELDCRRAVLAQTVRELSRAHQRIRESHRAEAQRRIAVAFRGHRCRGQRRRRAHGVARAVLEWEESTERDVAGSASQREAIGLVELQEQLHRAALCQCAEVEALEGLRDAERTTRDAFARRVDATWSRAAGSHARLLADLVVGRRGIEDEEAAALLAVLPRLDELKRAALQAVESGARLRLESSGPAFMAAAGYQRAAAAALHAWAAGMTPTWRESLESAEAGLRAAAYRAADVEIASVLAAMRADRALRRLSFVASTEVTERREVLSLEAAAWEGICFRWQRETSAGALQHRSAMAARRRQLRLEREELAQRQAVRHEEATARRAWRASELP